MIRSSQRGTYLVGLVFLAAIAAVATPVRASEIWIAPTYQQDVGGVGVASNVVWPVTAVGAVRLAWSVPADLQTFNSAKVVLIPSSPGGASTLNVFICPAQNNGAVAAGCVGPFQQAFTGVPNQLAEVEIGGLLATHIGTPGSTYLSVLAFTTPTTTNHIVGLRFAFTPTAPIDTASLGSNTFTGTQTAPLFSGAFSGNGSALTSLPFPAGAATLGSNTFSGVQTAPAFFGSGAGLTNLPFPTGAATLNVNTFNGTQTISNGNLELGTSTNGAGNLTKNGSTYLSNFGTQNNFLGLNAGNAALTGAQNNALGFGSLAFITSGNSNTAMGDSALAKTTTGGANAAFGTTALYENVGGINNTAAGATALRNNTTGTNNVGVGYAAGLNTTTGSNNIYLGANVAGAADESNTMYLGRVGQQSRTFMAGVRGITTTNADAMPVVIDSAGQLGTAPASLAMLGANTFTGTQTAPAFVGDGSGLTNLQATNLTGVINNANLSAAVALLDGSGKIPVGNLPIGSTASTVAAGNDSRLFDARVPLAGSPSYIQNQSLSPQVASFNISGSGTIGGNLDLASSTSSAGNITKNGTLFLHNFGTANTFLGVGAGTVGITGSANTGMGTQALSAITVGGGNTATGFQALLNNTGGSYNTAVGQEALLNNVGDAASGLENTAVGFRTLHDNATGSLNVAVGDQAGLLATGSSNIYLGARVWGVAGESNTMHLGNSSGANGPIIARTFMAGVRGVTTGSNDAIPVVIDSNGQLGTVSSSIRFKEDIRDMADASRRLFRLRPVTFRYTQAFRDGSKPIQYGLIAEEVAQVFPELAVRGPDGQVETVHYEILNVLLLNELQTQQRAIEALTRRVNELEASRNAIGDR